MAVAARQVTSPIPRAPAMQAARGSWAAAWARTTSRFQGTPRAYLALFGGL